MQAISLRPQSTIMTLEVTDKSVASRIKSFLKLIDGVKSVKVKKAKHVPNELELSLEEARQGKTVEFESVKDVMDYLHS